MYIRLARYLNLKCLLTLKNTKYFVFCPNICIINQLNTFSKYERSEY